MKALLLIGLCFFVVCGAAFPQALKTNYPQLVLTGGEVLANARVTSFNGAEFVVEHTHGIAHVAWERMPEQWRDKFPRDDARAKEEASRIKERATPPVAATAAPRPPPSVPEEVNSTAVFEQAIGLGQVKIGMNAEQCVRAWGEPFKVAVRSVTADRTQETWVYYNKVYRNRFTQVKEPDYLAGSKYLKFENGILTAVSDYAVK